MRFFETLSDATLEIRRDLSKSPLIQSSRVQQWTDLNLDGREVLGYAYQVRSGIPDSPQSLLAFANHHNFSFFFETDPSGHKTVTWLKEELKARSSWVPVNDREHLTTDLLHPALKKTLEGSYPGYTYEERLGRGTMINQIIMILLENPDSRRAYWPIFTMEDAMRAHAPTRVPCSLGYQFLIRKVGKFYYLMTYYYQRSADFDRFWLTDVYFAYQLGRLVAQGIKSQARMGTGFDNLKIGPFSHFITSFHSFEVETKEIY